MPKEYSPFTPGIPVPIDFFVGRISEVQSLVGMAKSATAGRLKVAFLTGERGIGKSSLAAFVRHVASKENGSLSLHTFLGGVTTLEEMARRIFDRLLKDSVDTPWYGKIRDFLGNHVRQAGLFGVTVEFAPPQKDFERLGLDFVPALRNLVAQLRDTKKGLFLILDDINGLSESAKFADWLKSSVDEIATGDSPLPLCLLLVGLPERRLSLIKNQPSLARVFDLVEIKPWNEDEAREFFTKSFQSVGIPADKEALELLVKFCGGLPVLGHEIGDAVFKLDTDDLIKMDDAASGVIEAAEVIGRKYLEPRVFQVIRSEHYRSILRKLPEMGTEFRRKDVADKLTTQEVKVFDNFLRKMTELDVIRRVEEGRRGEYRFSNLLYKLYIRIYRGETKEKR